MMQVKRYVAATFAEALILAKNELGTDAVIVESRKMKVGGLFGLFGREMTELTVAVDTRSAQKPAPPRPAARSAPPAPSSASIPAPAPAAAQPPQSVTPPAPPPQPVATQTLTALEREVAGLKAALTRLADQGLPGRGLEGYGEEAFGQMLAIGVDEAIARQVGQQLSANGAEGQAMLRAELERLIGPGAPTRARKGERKVVALVGPTGVGKTTTLAKLAAHFALDQGLDVGLITSDTFRIAAIEQLRTYADILGVPVYAVDRPDEVAHALQETAAKDLILCDTGGRSHRDPARMAELQELLAVLCPDEVHLVLGLNLNPRDAVDALERFLPLGVNRLAFTKLDETSAPGLIVNLRTRCEAPISFLTHGQSVPDDIIPADQANFAKILLGA